MDNQNGKVYETELCPKSILQHSKIKYSPDAEKYECRFKRVKISVEEKISVKGVNIKKLAVPQQ